MLSKWTQVAETLIATERLKLIGVQHGVLVRAVAETLIATERLKRVVGRGFGTHLGEVAETLIATERLKQVEVQIVENYDELLQKH